MEIKEMKKEDLPSKKIKKFNFLLNEDEIEKPEEMPKLNSIDFKKENTLLDEKEIKTEEKIVENKIEENIQPNIVISNTIKFDFKKED